MREKRNLNSISINSLKKDISLKITLCLLVNLVIILSSVYAIDEFRYFETDTNAEIINKMNIFIGDFDALGYSTSRFIDIREQTVSYSDSSNRYKFLQTSETFKNISDLALDVIKKYERISNHIELLSKVGVGINKTQKNQVIISKIRIDEEKYEEANKLLIDTNNYISRQSDLLFDIYSDKIDNLSNELKSVSDFSIIERIKKDFDQSKSEENIELLIEVIIDFERFYVLKEDIIEINNHIIFFNQNSIDTKKLDDIFDQVLFYVNRGQYENINDLHLQSVNLFESAKKYISLHDAVNEKINSRIPYHIDFVKELNTMIDDSYIHFINADFDIALNTIQNANNKLIEYESRFIVSGNLKREGFSIIGFFNKNKETILITLLLICILALVFYREITVYMSERMVREYEKGIEDTIQIIKNLQKKYFVKKNISKARYESQLKVYQRKLAQSTKNVVLLKDRLKKEKKKN